MTEKENYLRILKGEDPEWVPSYFNACTLVAPSVYENKVIEGSGNPDNMLFDPMSGVPRRDHERYTNMLGVEYTYTVDGAMPTVSKHILTDITKWREQIPYPFPNLDKIDFKAQAEKFYSLVDHDEKAVAMIFELVFFDLINTMGVAEGLCALMEEPEAVHDFFQEMTDFEIKKLRLAAPHYKPDVVILGDDVATVRELFMSPQVYTEMIAPYHKQFVNAVLELGLICEMHCCGKCEKLIPQWVDMGITAWQTAQPVNDLKAIKAKYGRKFVLNGCWDTAGKGGLTGAPEEVVRASVRETIDEFAPGGGFVFWDQGMTGGDFEKFSWTMDEATTYGKTFYKK